MNIELSRQDAHALVNAAVSDVADLPIRLSLGSFTTVHLSIEEAGEVVDAIIAALAAATG